MVDQLSSRLASLRIERRGPPPPAGSPKPGPSGRRLLALGLLAASVAMSAEFAVPAIEARWFRTPVHFTEVVSVSPAAASVRLTSAGYVVPLRISRVAPKVTGKVLAVRVAQGEHVEAGQELVTLDPTDDDASIAVARRRVDAARARARSADTHVGAERAQLGETELQFERERRLAGLGATATGVAEDLGARVKSLRLKVEGAQADALVARTEAEVEAADLAAQEIRRGNLILRAPIAGVVITRPPQPGEVVSPQPPGVSVDMGSLQIADLESLTVETDVPEARLHLLRLGAPAEIRLDAFPERRYAGKMVEITPRVDRSKATVAVRVAFAAATDGVLPDMAARVSFLDAPLDDAALAQPPKTVVPKAALASRAGGQVVFTVEDDTVHAQPVQLGAGSADGFELMAGPRPGTRVVADPPETLADGQRVRAISD
jgi:HlyD family secretion protein